MASRKLNLIGWLAVCLLLTGVGLGVFLPRGISFWTPPPSQQPTPLNTATVLTQIQGLSELVTVKYVLERVVVLEDEKWYGENRLLLLAHGVAKAGIDLGKVQPGDIDIDQKRIVLFLPPATITDVYLDEEKSHVIEHSTGLLREFDKNLESNARRKAVEEIRLAARYNGILEDARDRAKLQLTALFLQLGFEEVDVRAD